MNLNLLEAQALLFIAGLLSANKAKIEAVTGPFVVSVVNGALKIADQVFAALPFGLGGYLDQALAKYAQTFEGDLTQYENQGIDGLVAYLQALAAKLQGSH